MKPSDPRVRAQLGAARGPLALVLAAGLLSGPAVVLQAFALTALVVAAVGGHPLMWPAVGVAAAFAGRALIALLGDLAAAGAAVRVAESMRSQVLSAVLGHRTGAMSEGEVAALATRGVDAAQPYLTRYLPALVPAAVLPPLVVVVIATQDLLSAVIVLATLPLVPVFGALVGLATRDRAERQWRAMESLAGHFVDVMRGLPTLVAFRRADAQERTIRTVTDRYREATVRTLRIAFASSAVLELVATLSVALVAVVVGVRLAAGDIELSTGLVVLLLAPEAYWPLRRVGAEFHAAAEGVATFERMADLAEQPTEPSPTAVPGTGPLVLDQVCFVHSGRTRPVVEGLDLRIVPGSLTVLRGPSGVGKSTVLSLLAGLTEPTSGTVTVGGAPIFSDAWRARVSWVPQRPTFVPGSVADNLRLVSRDASDAQLWSALDAVALAERVRLLGGLDAPIGEDGSLLSAGERARLALARTLVAGRDWVLLDEPTAHLDPVTSAVIRDVIADLARTAGVVVATHDEDLAAAADHTVTLAPPTGERVPAEYVPAEYVPAEYVPAEYVPAEYVSTETVDAPEPAASAPRPVARADERGDRRPRFVLSTVLGVLASSCGVALTATAGWLIVRASEHPAMLTMLVAIVGVRAFGIGRPVFRYAERLRSHDNALRLLTDERVAVYRTLVPLTPGRLGRRRGDVLSSVVDDVDAVMDRHLRVRLPLVTFAAVSVIAALVAALVLPVAGLLVALGAVLGAGVAGWLTRSLSRRPEHLLVAGRAEVADVVLDAASRAEELRMWQAGAGRHEALIAAGGKVGNATVRLARIAAVARAWILLVTAATVAAIAVAGTDALGRGDLSAPLLALLLLLPVALADVASGVVDATSLTGRVRAAEDRLARFAHLTPTVTEPIAPTVLSETHDVAVEADLGWDGRVTCAGLDLRLAEGETVAVVGPSGCGKSTLAATLIRFIDPVRGTARLGGVALEELRLDDVRTEVGLLADDPHVFASTVLENVRLARPGSSEAEVEAAVRAARLGPWLDALPDGLETWIGEGHSGLSGGERARLGLARSILADQPVLVLDEPVAHLDADTAARVAADLLAAARGRTVVWITHRSTGLDLVDRVLDLGGGLAAGSAGVSGYVHD